MIGAKELRLIGITTGAWIAVILSAWALFAVFNVWLVPSGSEISPLQEVMWNLGWDAVAGALSIAFAFAAKRAFRKRRELLDSKNQPSNE
jgi:hypothetical protein